jgi:type VI protein secretion system component VasK
MRLLPIFEKEGVKRIKESANNYHRFQTLKHYLMLGQVDKRDAEPFLSWLNELIKTSPTLTQHKTQLMHHLSYVLGHNITVDRLNRRFLVKTQRYLASRSKIELFYHEFIKSYKELPKNIFDMEQIAGLEWKGVFIEPELEFQNVSRLYMPELFKTLSSHAMKEFVALLASEQWVLGSNYIIDKELLTAEMMRMYEYEYISTWRGFLSNAKVSKISKLKLLKQQINALTESTIFKLINIAANSTDLMDETQKAHLQQQLDKFNVSTIEEMAEFTTIKNNSQTKIASSFVPLHDLIKEGKLEVLQAQLNDKFSRLKQYFDNLDVLKWQHINSITTEIELIAQLQPKPLNDWLKQIVTNIDSTFRTENSLRLNTLWQPVYERCHRYTVNRYPFYDTAERDVAADSFNRLFSKSGLVTRFKEQHLKPYITQTAQRLKWHPIFRNNNKTAAQSLRFFEKSSLLTKELFKYNPNKAQINLSFYPWTISHNSRRFELKTGGAKIYYQYGTPHEEIITWPLHTRESGAELLFTDRDKTISEIFEPGELSIFKLLKLGQLKPYKNKTKLSFTDGKHTMNYLFKTEKNEDPFVFRKVENYRCPKKIM